MIVFKNTFQNLGGCFLEFGKKTSTDCQNCIFICREKHLQVKILPEKNKQLDKFSDIERRFFGKFGRKNWFLAKSYQHSCHKWILHFQRDILGKNVSRKKIIKKKCICTLSGVLVSFYRICLACLSKTFHRLQMKVLRKIIFLNKKLFTKFLQNVERCRTLAMNLLPIVKNAFHLSTGTFREKFVFGKNIKCSITFFRNRGEFFFRDLGRKQVLGRKASARLPKLESTLPKCFSKKTYFFEEISVLELFFRLLAAFFRTLAKNIKRLSNWFFICLEQLLHVTIFCWETKEFGNFSQKSSAVFFKFSTTKSIFGWELSAQFSKLDSALPLGTFGETHVLPKKKPMNNQIFSGILVFLSFFGMIIKKASLCQNESIEGKCFFFLGKKCSSIFLALERRIVILCRWISKRLSKMRLVCLEEIFSRRLFLFWKFF